MHILEKTDRCRFSVDIVILQSQKSIIITPSINICYTEINDETLGHGIKGTVSRSIDSKLFLSLNSLNLNIPSATDIRYAIMA